MTVLVVVAALGFAALVWIVSSSSPPPTKSSTITMSPVFDSSWGVGTCNKGNVSTYNVTLYPSAPASTETFGMTLTTSSGGTLATAAPITNGTAPNLVATLGGGCGAGTASAWYGVLWTSSGTPVAVYGTGGTNGWTALISQTLSVTLSSGMFVEVITSSPTASTDNFNCVGINGNSVTGSTTL